METVSTLTVRCELSLACDFLAQVEARFGGPIDRRAFSVNHLGWRARVSFYLYLEFPSRDQLRAIVEQLVIEQGFEMEYDDPSWWRKGQLDVNVYTTPPSEEDEEEEEK